MPTTFFIGDTHFGHKNIIKFGEPKPHRDFATIEEHDEELIKRWNSVVKKDDLVYHLGDVAFGIEPLNKLHRCNGRKRLVMGNHDHYETTTFLEYFEKLYGVMQFKKGILSHVPLHPDNLERFQYNIHGHTHHYLMADPRYVCVSAERINLTPISLEELRARTPVMA